MKPTESAHDTHTNSYLLNKGEKTLVNVKIQGACYMYTERMYPLIDHSIKFRLRCTTKIKSMIYE